MKSLIQFPGRKIGGLIFWIGCIGGAILALFGPIMMWTLLAIPAAIALPFYIKSSLQRRRYKLLLHDGMELTVKNLMFRHKSGFADGLAAKVYVDDYNSDRYTVEIFDMREWFLKE